MGNNANVDKYAGTCPRCKSPLEWHTATLTGEQYKGCTNYPTCKYNTRSYAFTPPHNNNGDYETNERIVTDEMLLQAQYEQNLEYTSQTEKSLTTRNATAQEQYDIFLLYHITRMGNIPSILEFGLLSNNKTKEKGIWTFSSSNHEIQARRAQTAVGNLTANDYVPLFFSKKTPMLCAIEGKNKGVAMVYICINPDVMSTSGVYFSDGNIAANATKHYCDLKDLCKLDWANIWGWNPDKIGLIEARRIKSAEVLVPHRIDPTWFTKLIVPDDEVKINLQDMVPFNIPIEVNSEFYFTHR